ncbi:amino acid adenylation domain-containing protein (plasmid) [Tistrella bauzanensis]|uniref:amino acid adenylation domain-containing protein n=1 Tax=Tistrella TaxID=171436 RepID=UPI0031F61DCF
MTMDSYHRSGGQDDAPQPVAPATASGAVAPATASGAVAPATASGAVAPTGFRDKANVAEIFYLSDLQQGMLGHALKGGADPYHIRHVFEIDGALDVARFERAWAAVIARHAILRADIRWREIARPVHIVYRRTMARIDHHDWRALDPAAQAARLAADWATARAAGFDFARAADPALDLIRIGDDRWWFTWRFHHLQLDGWSVARILSEVLTGYTDSMTLAGAVPSFRSHIKWLEQQDKTAGEDWWRADLAGIDGPTPLPRGRPAPAMAADGGAAPHAHAERRQHLDPATTSALADLARRAGGTMTTVLQAAWGWLLGAHAGREDVCFGLTTAGRPADLADADSIAGLFINTVPLRLRIDPSETVAGWLAAVQRHMLDLRSHDHLPLARLRGLVQTEGDAGLFDSILVVENFPVDAALSTAATGDIRITAPRIGETADAMVDDAVTLTDGRNHYPLSLIAETGAALSLTLAYDLGHYGHGDIARLMDALVAVLRALPEQAARRLGDFSPWSAGSGPDGDAEPMPMPASLLPARIARLAAADPDVLAVADADGSLSRAALWSAAGRLAAELQARGVEPGARVALALPRGRAMVAAILGVWRVGGAYVPLDPAAPAARLGLQLADCGAGWLIAGDAAAGWCPPAVALISGRPEAWGADDAGAATLVDLPAAAEAYIIYTSGSTGTPKGISVSHGALAAYLAALSRRLDITDGAGLAAGWVSTPAADLGHSALFGALWWGAALHVPADDAIFDPDRFGAWMQDHQIDLLKIVPSHLAGLMQAAAPARVLPRRYLLLGGEALPAGLARAVVELAPDCRLVNHYGPSETTVGVIAGAVAAPNGDGQAGDGTSGDGHLPLGRVLDHALVRLLDHHGNPAGPGQPAEICIGGAGVSDGYVGRAGQTAERFVPDAAGRPGSRLYRSGDRGLLLADGTIGFLGRLDDQVKIRGFRVEPDEVAAALRALPGVRQAVVIARADGEGRLRLRGFAAGDGLDGAALKQALAVRLPDAMVPQSVQVLDALPLTANGKIDRKALPGDRAAGDVQPDGPVAPRSATEAALLGIWQQVLKRQEIGVTDNFFEIGGDSILSLQLVARARKAGLKLTPKQIFDQPDIARLAACADAAAGRAVAAPDSGPGAGGAAVAADPHLPEYRAILEGLGQSLDGVADIYPATPLQRGLLFHSQMAGGEAVYINQLRLTLAGRFDVVALRAAWDAAIARHPVLRTRFEWRHGGTVLQVVMATADLPIEIHDWQGLAPDVAEARIRSRMAEDAARGFDLATAPLMRLALFVRPDGGHDLVWSNHHILTDGWSTMIVLGEVARDYVARIDGGGIDGDLPAPPPYRAYVDWLARQPDPEPWWRQQIARIDEPALLTAALARPTAPEPGAHQYRVLLDEAMTTRLTMAARRMQVTLNTLVQGAWALLLARHGGRDQAAFGVTVSGRPADLVGVEHMPGLFINSLPVWVDVPATARPAGWLQDIQALNAGLRQVEQTSLADVQRWSGLSGDALFDTLLVFQNFPIETAIRDIETRLGITGADAVTRTHYPLTLMVVPGARLDLRWEWDGRRFDRAVITRLHGHLLRLLAALSAEDADAPIGLIDPLAEDERSRLLSVWNDIAVPYDLDGCVQDLIAPWVARHPEAPAVVAADGAVLSYAALDAAANRLAHRLIGHGIGADVTVALCLPRGPVVIIALLAVMKAGGAYVPLDPNAPDDRLRYMVDTARTRLVITDTDNAGRFPGIDTLPIDDEPAAADASWPHTVWPHTVWPHTVWPDTAPAPRAHPGSLAYVIFTSGSTGRPKGVMIPHRGVVNYLRVAIDRYLTVDDDGRASGQGAPINTPLGFDATVTSLMVPLITGRAVTLLPEADEIAALSAALAAEAQDYSLVKLTPAHIEALKHLRPAGAYAGHARALVIGGEALMASTVAPWLAASPGTRLFNEYGPTETVVGCAIHEVVQAADGGSTDGGGTGDGALPIGRPIANTSILILDDDLRLMPEGAAGGLYIGGAGLARGYAGQPGLTADRFVPHPFAIGERLYRTGDLARWRADGTLDYLGRLDDQVKIRGYRIELGEIESALTSHDAVEQAVVVVRTGLAGSRQLTAYAVPRAGRHVQPDDLLRHLAARLPQYMVPADLLVLDTMPLTANGKVDRRALPVPQRGGSAIVMPSDAIEAALLDIWQGVLGQSGFGVTDSFFDLGGDSILSMQVVARAARAGIRLTARQVFEHPRIDRLAALARAADDAAALTEITGTDLALTPIQSWFFARHPDGPSHWNQSVLLRVNGRLDIVALERAIAGLVAAHDALRLRFRADHVGHWRQRVVARETADLLVVRDVADLAALDAAGEAVQASLDIRTGPVLRAGCFHLADGSDRLLIVLHHLAVDGVSWRVLLDDLQQAYEAACTGRPVVVPAPATPWSRWVDQLHRQAASPEQHAHLLAELGWWQGHLEGAAPAWGPARSGGRLEVERGIAEAMTRRLITEVPRAYRVTVEEVLLAALARAIGDEIGAARLLVSLEGHGRDGDHGLDLSRTIGWFTTRHDVALPTRGDDARLLADLRQVLRRVPGRGTGRGLLAIAGDQAIRDAAAALPAADVSFNYLGRFDGSLEEGGRFWLGTETAGRNIGRRGRMEHALEINAAVTDGRLRIGWRHDPAVIDGAAMAALIARFERGLTDLVGHCLTADPTPVPVDYPLAGLDDAGLARLEIAPGTVEDIYPATPLQQGLILHSQRSAGAYVNQLRLTLAAGGQDGGALDVEALAGAWAAAIARHPILRTRFDWRHGGNALQIVMRRVTLPVDVHDLSAGPEGYEARLAAWRAADLRRGFDLTVAPLMRITLFRRPDGGHDLVWTTHHALTDGWSTARLLREVAREYDARVDGGAVEMSPAPPYRDYVAWMQRQPAPEAWWRAEAARIADPAGITEALGRPMRPEPGSHRLTVAVDDDLAHALRKLARREQVTLATIMQAGWALLLGRLAGRAQAGIGVTVSGRPADLAGVERMLGLFINSLPVWIDLPPSARLGAWLRDVQALNTRLRQVEHSSLADVQRWTGRSGDGLFDSLLVFENYPIDAAAGQSRLGAATTGTEMVERTHYPLVLAVVPGQGLELRWGWDGARIDAAAVARLNAAFIDLLGRLAAAGDVPLGSIAAGVTTGGTDEPARLALAHPFRAVTARISAQAAADPAREAVACDGRRISYGALEAWSGAIADRLILAGIRPEDRVGLCVERSVGLVAALLGVLKAGGAYVPLDPDYPAARLRHMIEDSRLDVLVVGPASLPAMRAVADDRPLIDVEALKDAAPATGLERRHPPVRPDQLAYVIYTSGSTGLPKGVGISHAALSHHLDDFIPAFDYRPEDAGLQFSTINFDAAVEQMLPLLTVGGRIVLRGPAMWDAAELTAVLQAERLTIADIPTGYWQQWARDPDLRFGHLRRVTVGGEALSVDALARWTGGPLGHIRLDNRYGPTEATISALYHQTDRADVDHPPVPIGRTYPGRTARVVGVDGNTVPDGGIGELCIGGPALARGYLGRPSQTAEYFVPDEHGAPGARLYRSGDLCRRRADGVVVFLGRIDGQVKLRGFRIEPGEIEALLRAAPGIDDAVAGVVGDRLIAWVAGQGDPAALRADLGRQLPAHMVPQAVVVLDALPLMPSGKVDHRALPVPDAAHGPIVPPATILETRLLAIWRRVLGRDGFGITDSFFDIGGDSLLALQVAAAARADGIDGFSLDALFLSPTIAGLAAGLESAGQAAAGDPDRMPANILPLNTRDVDGTPLFCIHPGYGLVQEYRPLAAVLNGQVPVLGIQAPRLIDPDWTVPDVAALAADYVARLRRIQPAGPYRLAGWSLGGWIAMAMARALEADGDIVERLILIDTAAEVPRITASHAAIAAQLNRDVDSHTTPELAAEFAAGRAGEMGRTGVVDRAGEMGRAGDGSAAAGDRDRLAAAALDLVLLHKRLLEGWPVPRVEAAITLFRAVATRAGGTDGSHIPAASWRPLAGGGLAVIDIDAGHDTILHHPDFLAAIARVVDQAGDNRPASDIIEETAP